MTMLIHELHYADDCGLVAYSQEEIQLITSMFALASERFDLTINKRKTEGIYQPASDKSYTNSLVYVNTIPLKSVE